MFFPKAVPMIPFSSTGSSFWVIRRHQQIAEGAVDRTSVCSLREFSDR